MAGRNNLGSDMQPAANNGANAERRSGPYRLKFLLRSALDIQHLHGRIDCRRNNALLQRGLAGTDGDVRPLGTPA